MYNKIKMWNQTEMTNNYIAERNASKEP